MNLNLIRTNTNEFLRTLAALWREAANLLATFLFWLVMIGLVSCPVWLPPLVESLSTR